MNLKVLVVILIVLVIAFVYVTRTEKSPQDMPEPVGEDTKQGYWEKPIPEGTRLVTDRTPKFNVEVVRRNEGTQPVLEFHITEEHGFMVDGISVEFWFRFKDDDTGEWIDDTKTIKYLCRARLGFNETLVDKTVLLDTEFQHLGIDLLSTTSDNWGAQVVEWMRVMEPAGT